jgi:hypothetical protein
MDMDEAEEETASHQSTGRISERRKVQNRVSQRTYRRMYTVFVPAIIELRLY